MKALVSYYSRTGTMEKICEMVKENLVKSGAEVDVVRVMRKTDVSYFTSGYEAVMGVRPEIVNEPVDLTPYDMVFVGFPIWAGRPASPVYSFIERCMLNQQGKKFVSLSVSAAKDHAAKGLPLAATAIEAVGGQVVGGMAFCQRMREENVEKAASIAASAAGGR